MDLCEAKLEVKQLLSRVKNRDLSRLLQWVRESDDLDELLSDNRRKILQNISEDLRGSKPTVHVDSFLYDEEEVDSLCDEGSLSRSYCLSCGSTRTAPLDFLSHSFSIPELHFLFESVLPDLSGRVLVDVGSRLGAGYVFSSASRLVGLEISEEFVKLQENIVQKYTMTDRIQVLHSDVRLQNVLLQNADVLVLNNVFEYFLPPEEQMLLPPCWVEELPLDYDVYLGKDTDPDALRQIHLYRVL
ncbi:hypothetical protein F7725_008787 [Dissostichus mawsoni]|uniref:Uncharacterized protein n=1 Tax=Dissostichus mawsoni TaxID=36200 RepID=A0A7J5Y851_DISMA|nr:hypothetical protein F7725_008787 [Dissostichus mawsoni]